MTARRRLQLATCVIRSAILAGADRPAGGCMRYGFYLPTRGALATPGSIERLVQRGEVLGYHAVVVADHVALPRTFSSKYPYTLSGAFPSDGDALEQLSLLAFVAAKTRTLRLISSVLIVPYRNP